MIPFNEPVYLKKGIEYITEAVAKNRCLNGDGPFTAKCTKCIIQRRCLPLHVPMRWKWRHC